MSEGQSPATLKLRAFIDAVLAIAWSALPDGSLDFVNKRFRDYTGLPSEQLTGWEWKSVVHPDDIPQLETWWLDVRKCEEAGTTEKRLRRFDGAYRWFRIAAAPVHDEQANLVRWCGINTDIDDLRSFEQKLRQEATDLRTITDAIRQSIAVLAADGNIVYLNQVFQETTGLTMREVNDKTLHTRVFHPDDLGRVLAERREGLLRGTPFEYEARLLMKDGQYRWWLIQYNPLKDERGHIIRWYGTGTDIDDRKRSEQKLQQSEQDLRTTIDAVRQYITVLALDGKVLYTNRVALDLTGLTASEVNDGGFFPRAFHPDDVDRVRTERQANLLRGTPFDLQMRLRFKNGQYRWQLFQYNPLIDESGQIIRWYCTATDIDDQKRTEERLRNENLVLREEIDRSSMFEDIVGSSEPLRKVLRDLRKVAPSDSTVLILGETGTGKELIARAIHKQSSRSARAFVAVNCAAIPPSLIASELFGHEKGAFTGATERRIGRFEAANGGTIFLDEVGDLPAEVQISLLRVLQEREVEHVGSNKPIRVDVRVLAATHRDLERLVSEGRFRQDLLYRLNVVPIEVPSLRERAADISLLVEYFIARFGKKAGKKFRTIDKSSLKLLQKYKWPGNVRELQNVVERAVILSDSDTFAVDEAWLRREESELPQVATPLSGALLQQERDIIEAALAASHGRVAGPAGAAAKLGVPTRTLDSKIKRLGIDKYRFKSNVA
jgi:formate hydrogenlyase transcriptional activator